MAVALALAAATLVGCVTTGPWAADGARILAVELMASRSHWNFMSAVLRSLTDAGHRVTVFTPLPDGERDGYEEVDVSGALPARKDNNFAATMTNQSDPYVMVSMMAGFTRKFCDAIYADPRFAETVQRLRDRDRAPDYDAIVVEPMVVDCMSYLVAGDPPRLPIIYVIPTVMYTFLERAFTGHVSNPACVSHQMARHATPRTFSQRFANALLLAYSTAKVAYDEWTLWATDPKPYVSTTAVPPDVVFLNSHHIIEAPRPVLPNVIDVGGIHLRPANTIPKDVLDYIEDSPHGVIYFTLGSLIKMSSLPKGILKAFKVALSKVPQRVLWKYETEMTETPKNVMIKKWFPQREILYYKK